MQQIERVILITKNILQSKECQLRVFQLKQFERATYRNQ